MYQIFLKYCIYWYSIILLLFNYFVVVGMLYWSNFNEFGQTTLFPLIVSIPMWEKETRNQFLTAKGSGAHSVIFVSKYLFVLIYN